MSFWRFPALALALAAVALLLGALDIVSWWLVFAVIAAASWMLILGLVRDVSAAVKAVPRNDFGLCRSRAGER